LLARPGRALLVCLAVWFALGPSSRCVAGGRRDIRKFGRQLEGFARVLQAKHLEKEVALALLRKRCRDEKLDLADEEIRRLVDVAWSKGNEDKAASAPSAHPTKNDLQGPPAEGVTGLSNLKGLAYSDARKAINKWYDQKRELLKREGRYEKEKDELRATKKKLCNWLRVRRKSLRDAYKKESKEMRERHRVERKGARGEARKSIRARQREEKDSLKGKYCQ